MKINKRFINFLIFLIIFLIISYLIGSLIGSYFYDFNVNENEILYNNEDYNLKLNLSAEVSNDNNKLDENTKIVYEIFYKESDFIQKTEDLIPDFMIGISRKEVESLFPDWSLKSFSPQKIVLQKVINFEPYETYFLTEYDGNIAIFLDDKSKKLIELINKPIYSLPEEEQLKIKSGIYIKGKNELINFIQDYES